MRILTGKIKLNDNKIIFEKKALGGVFDLYKPTLDVIKFVIPRHEKNAMILLDYYNLISQEGVKWAVRDSGVNIRKCIQTQSGQLICYT